MKIRNILFATSMLCAFSGAAMAYEVDAPPPGPGHGQHGQMGDAHFARVDTNNDGVLTREEARAAHSARFATIDADHDGFLTREEMRNHRQTQMREVRARVHSQMQSRHTALLDANRDGNISRAEWNNAPRAMEEQRQKMREERFGALDTNHDGQLSAAEMQAGHGGQRGQQNATGGANNTPGERQMPPPQRPPNPDTNNDTKISRAEWDAMALPMFDRGDLNHDGRVTREEAAQSMRNRQHGPGHRPNRGQMFHSPPGGGN
ncbi:MAG: EF hand domain-containing protein [Hyphomonadaceae bacterium]|nr:MAG: EF hand domain-containing protein [Hyphomonadaceae bacterium]KAF0183846.1 MAG: EF hand domain-containing protein [Hyphomonadaceae bacterium]